VTAVATSAVRDAANGPAFLRRVRRELGFPIRTLSGVEEARYGFLGAVGGLPVDHGVLFDLGGGSLQLGRFRGRRLVGAVSVPLGALRTSDAFLRSDPPTAGEVRRCASTRARSSTPPGSDRSRKGRPSWARAGRCATWPGWTSGRPATRSAAFTGTC
jgi:exopolyphosphatase/pppGpp-phosphohydrolase